MVHMQPSSQYSILPTGNTEGEITGGTVLELFFHTENMQKRAYL